MSNVFLTSCEGYEDPVVQKTIQTFLSHYSEQLIACQKILLKPNLLQAAIPEKAITTHPLFLETVIKELRQVTSAKLCLADSPGSNFDNYDDVLDKTGIGSVCQQYDIEILKVEHFKPKNDEGMIYSSLVDEVDLLINLPKLKTHALTGMTMAVKNLFGLIPGTHKVSFHRDHPKDDDLANSIYEYFCKLQVPMLHILDGVLAHEGEGPSRGVPVAVGVVGCSNDAVGLDLATADILGIHQNICKTNIAAIAAGYDPTSIHLIADIQHQFPEMKLPVSSRISLVPSFIKKLVADNVHVWPLIDNDKCISCLLCLKSCPAYAITNTGKFPVVDRKKCIECFCCYEVCESDAINLKRSFLHKVIVK